MKLFAKLQLMRQPARRFLADRRALEAVEFALVVPFFLLFLFAILGVGLDGFYQLTLDDALRDSARQLQIYNTAVNGSGSAFATQFCQEFGRLAGNCSASLSYHVITNSSATNEWASLVPEPLPSNGILDDSFPASFPSGNNVLVEVAYPLPFKLPYIGNLITFTGTNSIESVTTVRVEPYG